MQASKITKALERAQQERQKIQQRLVRRKKLMGEDLKAFEATMSRDEQVLFTPVNTVNVDTINKGIHAYHDQHSHITEEYRIMRTNINSLNKQGALRVFLFSSSIENEGKTVSAINYGYTLACDRSKKVVLLDCDLRKGTMSHYFGFASEQRRGITDILQGDASLDDSLMDSGRPNFHLLFRGAMIDNPAEALESKAMDRLLKELRKRYDYVIIDAPPVLPVTDAAVLADKTDGVLMVIRMGKTPKTTVQQAFELLSQTRANVLGCVLTNVEYYAPGYKKYYYYTYGASKN